MEFDKRLHLALFEDVITEMASFSLPQPVTIPDGAGGFVQVKYLDMRWEDYKNPLIGGLGQYTPFSAQIPGTSQFIIWDGINARISNRPNPEYHTAPRSWTRMAQGMDEKGYVVLKPHRRRSTDY